MNDTAIFGVMTDSRGTGMGDPAIAVFLCVNGTRAGQTPGSGLRRRPTPPPFQWPVTATQVNLGCSARLQPEHLLKAFEEGYDAVCVIACSEDNCHCLEGSKRAHRRVDYVRGLLDEMGLGRNRLLLFNLPGSAREDMALGLDGAAAAPAAGETAAQTQAIVDHVMRALASLTPSPLRKNWPPKDPTEEEYTPNQDEESD
jgi:coenzyme F420-reducing hydrogenase delta subunit